MDGTPNNQGLLDVIAILASRAESGRLQITVGGSRGAFFFKKGKLVDAHMGPFSGFPAVNLAVSLGEATLQFDSSIQLPSSTSTLIANRDRLLLKERFGIETIDETIDLDSVEDRTTQIADAKLAEEITPQSPLPQAPLSTVASAPHENAYKEPADLNIWSKARARESRRRMARNRRAGRKKNETGRIADQSSNQAAEAVRTKVEKEKGFEMAESHAEQQELSRTSSPEITRGLSTIDLLEDAKTKRCPTCNRVYSDYKNYCGYDSTPLVSESDTSFNGALKPDGAGRHTLFWTLVITTLLISGVLGYLLNSYISREPTAARPIRTEPEPPPKAEQDQPVVEGLLNGKEVTLITPEYPDKAKSAGVSGKVTVAILVNKKGLVVSARVLNGEPLLWNAALAAARKTKFVPEKLAGEGSKISGTITYNFKL
jgi:TonB family protein